MNKETVLESLIELPSETSVKSWMFEIDSKFYQVASYAGFRVGDKTSIWECNKKGKRTKTIPIFTILGSNRDKCVNEFIDTFPEEPLI